MKKLLILVIILAFSTRVFAQGSSNAQPPDASKTNPSIVYPIEIFEADVIYERTYDAPPKTVLYSPVIYEDKASNVLAGSFIQDSAWSPQNNFGFSLSASEGYYSSDKMRENPLLGSEGKNTTFATSLSTNVFTNYAGRKAAMHLDYGAGYSFYPQRQNSFDDVEHSVNAAYAYRINNRARFQLRDRLSSSSNDPLSNLFSLNSSFDRLSAGSYYYDLILTPRRYTRNTASASFNSDVTGKNTNVQVFGSYDNYWYGEQDLENGILEDYYSARVGVGLNQRITRWLSLGSTYSIQLNNDLRDSRTHRVEVGRFQFDLSPEVEVHVSGGVEIADTGADQGSRTRVSAHSGISYSTPTNSRLYANYSRTMMSVSGFRRLLPSDTFSVGLGQPLGDRTNFRVMWYYQRSSDFYDSGRLTAHQGIASMEFVVAPGLFASASYWRRYQENTISSLSGIPFSERSMASVGLSYFWPSRRR